MNRFAHIKRDLIMFTLGAFGFVHELVVSNVERPYLIGACLALMGLPVALRYDERKREKGE